MSQIERVTILCDGPCGGNEASGGSGWSLKPDGLATKSVDMCGDCAALLREIYDKGQVVRAGRPAKTRKQALPRPSIEPTIEPMISPNENAIEVDFEDEPGYVSVHLIDDEPTAPIAPFVDDSPIPDNYDPEVDEVDPWSTQPGEVRLGTGT